ncbi:hypothetical protein BJ165DRAFT_5670 [Panaeolus papilionaceus]|nr:hypothetical protein BJ165DRAFT_5670 [Panaeolus papilionaceus]
MSWGIDDLNFEGIARELKLCARLRVFIHFTKVTNAGKFQAMFAVEPRMVIFDRDLHSYSAWISGTRGKPDVWSWAEGVVFARQHGYFNSNESQELFITHEFSWRDHLTETGHEWYEANIDRLPGGNWLSQQPL